MNEIGYTPNLIGNGVEKLLPSAQEPPNKDRIKAVGKEFEGVFMSMVLKEMRSTLEEGGFFGEETSDTYGGMFDLYIGQSLAESSPLGIAEIVLQSYTKNQPQQDQDSPQNGALNEPSQSEGRALELELDSRKSATSRMPSPTNYLV